MGVYGEIVNGKRQDWSQSIDDAAIALYQQYGYDKEDYTM
jgi:hypothetical protein